MPIKPYLMTHLTRRYALWLEVDERRFPLSSFVANFGINEIPGAECQITLGRRFETDTTLDDATFRAIERNPIHAKPPAGSPRARVYFHPEGDAGHREKWPADAKLIFEGRLVRRTHQRSDGGASVGFSLIHWLHDAAVSSMLNVFGSPNNPALLNVPGVLPSSSTNADGVAAGGWLSMNMSAFGVASRTGSRSDVWGSYKRHLSEILAIRSQFPRPAGSRSNLLPIEGKANSPAAEVLSRIEGFGRLPGEPGGRAYRYASPLSLDLLPEQLYDAVYQSMFRRTAETYANASLWDKLIGEVFPMLGLAIVPAADRAAVIADTPAFRGIYNIYTKEYDVWREIVAEDVRNFARTDESGIPVGGVYVTAPWRSSTGFTAAPLAGAPLVGVYLVLGPDGYPIGPTISLPAPMWLQSLDANRMGNPDDLTKLYDAFAKRHYASVSMRGNSMSFSGRLRFDIAPGSLVKVRIPGDRFIDNDALRETVYGCVSRVTIAVDPGSAQASTSFQLTHVRSSEDNAAGKITVDDNPLFPKCIHGGGYHGMPLVDDYEKINL